MRSFSVCLLVFFFLFPINILASNQNEENEVPETTKTKKEFMQACLNMSEAVEGVPVISPFANWDYYYLHKPISWTPESKHQNKYKAVKVPPGFVTDLTSIPQVFWSILSPSDRYAYAAIIHDYLYWTQIHPRDVADQILKICMEDLNVANVKVIAIYNAVRMFGGAAWEKNTKLKDMGEKRFLKKIPEDPQMTWDEWKNEKDIFSD
jgi:hypothetical protein